MNVNLCRWKGHLTQNFLGWNVNSVCKIKTKWIAFSLSEVQAMSWFRLKYLSFMLID